MSDAGLTANQAQPGQVPVTALLIGTIAIQTAVPPFATDMYTPAFPRVTADLATSASLVITSSSWRMTFWWLVGFGALMVLTAAWFVPETLHEERRHSGGLRATVSAFGELVSIRPFVGYLLTSTFSAFTMMAYIANSSYVLQVMKGMAPLPFPVFFASTA